MPSLDSDKVRQQLRTKLGCIEEISGSHYRYVLKGEEGKILSTTKVSLGAKHSIGMPLIALMTRQIRLGTTVNFAEMVSCKKSREECLEIIRQRCS